MNNLVSALVAAHRGQAATPDPESLPRDLASAMRTQREVAVALGARIAGWKLGFSADGTPVAGPLYEDVVQASPGVRSLPARGFIVEIELAFRLARDLSPGVHTRDDVVDAIEEALVGIELIRGRFGEPPTCAYHAFLADNLGNAGYVTGASTREFRQFDLKALRCTFEVDGKIVQNDVGGHPQGDPLAPLHAYANRQSDAIGGLKAGQVITTGSLTKPYVIDRAARVEANLENVGRVALTLRS
ncbi:MAG TPA: fumarylacetoacetate hydrolase family protein [Casimicrobiaceae bacterium]|nr:fumarylacetoacetate hydrolase family protein [Casimicrobiaceae bacterium]